MKFNLIHYLRHGRYRPSNLIESLFVQLSNLIYIDRSKNTSFHIFWYKKHLNQPVTITNLGELYY